MAVLHVEVVFALAQAQTVVRLELPPGSTVADAVAEAGLRDALGPGAPCYGIFGQRVAGDRALRDGDRVEIYRPLQADPRAVRRARAGVNPRRRR